MSRTILGFPLVAVDFSTVFFFWPSVFLFLPASLGEGIAGSAGLVLAGEGTAGAEAGTGGAPGGGTDGRPGAGTGLGAPDKGGRGAGVGTGPAGLAG